MINELTNKGSGLLEIKLGELVPTGVYSVEILYGDDSSAKKSPEFLSRIPKSYVLGVMCEFGIVLDCLEAEKNELESLAKEFGYTPVIIHLADFGHTWDSELVSYNEYLKEYTTAKAL